MRCIIIGVAMVKFCPEHIGNDARVGSPRKIRLVKTVAIIFQLGHCVQSHKRGVKFVVLKIGRLIARKMEGSECAFQRKNETNEAKQKNDIEDDVPD